MAANIPTLKSIYDDIINDFETKFSITIPVFGKAFIRAVAAVQAAKVWTIYMMVAFVQRNMFVDTADPEAAGGTLERWGRIKLGRSPFPATEGFYDVQVTGTDGATIPAGTRFKSDDDAFNAGVMYILDNAHTMNGTTDTITVRSLEIGDGARLEVGDTMTATSPITNVDDQGEVTSENQQPTAAESVELYRQRTIESFQLEPQGGAATDYRLWAADADGVRFVYPYLKSGAAGEVDLYVEATQSASPNGDGVPSQAIKDEVLEVVNFKPDTSLPLNKRGRRPLGVHAVNVLDVSLVTVTMTINGLSRSLTADEQSNIESALSSLLSDIRPHVDAANIEANRNDTMTANKAIITITNALPSGVTFTSLSDLAFNSTTQNSYQFTDGEIPELGTVTYNVA